MKTNKSNVEQMDQVGDITEWFYADENEYDWTNNYLSTEEAMELVRDGILIRDELPFWRK